MKTRKIIISALLASFICVATMIIKIPSPLKGYINLGDGAVLLSAILLPYGYGFAAAGLGSALADIFLGYFTYAPATFIIKGCMALCFKGIFNTTSKSIKKPIPTVIAGISSEFLMILGYFVFESFLYGAIPSLSNVPANGIQGFAGIIVAGLLIHVFEKQNLLNRLDK